MESCRKLCTPRAIFVINGVIAIPVFVTVKHKTPERESMFVSGPSLCQRHEGWDHTFLALCPEWSPGLDQSSLDRLCCKNARLMKQYLQIAMNQKGERVLWPHS